MDSTLDYYRRNAVSFTEHTLSADMSEHYARFERYLPKEGTPRILDLGCGSGRDSLHFLRKGCLVDALDGCEELCAAARELTGLPVRCALFGELSAVEEYDGVWASASLLHVPAEELPAVLARVRDSLKRNGVFYLSFKYGSGERDADGRHFTDLDEAGLEALLGAVPGLFTEEVWTSRDVRPGRENERWLNAVLRRPKLLPVVCALVRDSGRLYATQRGYGEWKDWWEFPGGKVEPGETPEAALVREIREELGARIEVEEFLHEVQMDYPRFRLSLRAYLCRVAEGELTLREHEAARWLSPEEYFAPAWLPADRELVEKFIERNKEK